jgi:hypothetical protein
VGARLSKSNIRRVRGSTLGEGGFAELVMDNAAGETRFPFSESAY